MSAGKQTEGLWVCGACTSWRALAATAEACTSLPPSARPRGRQGLASCPWEVAMQIHPGEPPAACFQDGERPGDAGLQPPSPVHALSGRSQSGDRTPDGAEPGRQREAKKGAKLGPAATSQGWAGLRGVARRF